MARKQFRYGETRPAGHVFFIPEDARVIADKGDRRHCLLHNCPEELDPNGEPEPGVLATLGHMTTKDTEQIIYHAPFHRFKTPSLQPTLPDQPGSFLNGVRFVFRDIGNLFESVGVANAFDCRGCRTVVREGLGIESGLPGAAAPTSVRGRLVRLLPDVAKQAGFAFGVILTNHWYSAERRYQAVVPIVDVRSLLFEDEVLEDFEHQPGEILPGNGQSWRNALPPDWLAPLIDVVRLISLTEQWRRGQKEDLWLPKQITMTSASIDAATLGQIEDAFITRLSL